MNNYNNNDNQNIIDGLLLKIEAQNKHIDRLIDSIDKLSIADYLHRQFIYQNRDSLLGDFSEFAAEWAKECANSFGFDRDITNKRIVSMLSELAEDDFNEVEYRRVASAINKVSSSE